MESQPHSWKLRRIFGSQPRGGLVGPRQPEADIPVQVTQAQSSHWNFLSSDDGDLATWRIRSRVTTGGRPAHSSPASPSDSPPPSVRTFRGSPQPHLRTTSSPHYLEQQSKRLLRLHRSASSCSRQATSFRLKTESNL